MSCSLSAVSLRYSNTANNIMETMTITDMVKVAKQLDRLDWMINFPDKDRVQCQAITAAVTYGLKKAQLHQVCEGLGLKYTQRATNAALRLKIVWEC